MNDFNDNSFAEIWTSEPFYLNFLDKIKMEMASWFEILMCHIISNSVVFINYSKCPLFWHFKKIFFFTFAKFGWI